MSSSKSDGNASKRRIPVKLARLPKNVQPRKRPILHPPIPSQYTSSSRQKVVYVSTHTPFISAVKRVRKLLEHINRRAMGKIDILNDKIKDRQRLQMLSDKMDAVRTKKPEEVILKGTSRAIERVLSLGLFFQGQLDCRVQIRTGSAAVIDDIVERKRPIGKEQEVEPQAEQTQDLPESRIRNVSVVEVAVTLK